MGNKMETSKKFLQSYLFSEDVSGNIIKYYISSCYRKSTTIYQDWFYETFAWELDENNHRGNRIIADNSGATTKDGAFEQHMEVIMQLEATGEFKEADHD